MNFEQALKKELKEISNFLLEKNKAYGNSALEPIRIFSKASKLEQLYVRMDDKLSRIKRGQVDNEDVLTDLLGYLIIERLAKKYFIDK